MAKNVLIAAASAIALIGCASTPPDQGAGTRAAPAFDPKNPKVTIVTNNAGTCAQREAYIVVDQEPIYFFRSGNAQAFHITWEIVTNGYSFVDEPNITNPKAVGKTLTEGEIHSCHASGKKMQCTNKAQNPGTWKYTLKVKADDSGCPSPPDLDPIIGNG